MNFENLKNLINTTHRKMLLTVTMLAFIVVVSMTLIGFVVPKDVTLLVDNKEITVTTSRIYVEEFLAEQGISLQSGDRISKPLDSVLQHNGVITIERARKIVLTADGTTRDIYSCEPVLKDALKDCGIVLGEQDEVTPGLDTKVQNAMGVTIVRVKVFEETRRETVLKETIIKPSYEKKASHSVVLTEGEDGSADITYKVTMRDGVEIGREEVSRTVLKETVNRVVEKGLQGSKIVTASTSELKVKKVIDCSATAYTAYNGARTASGRVAAYGIVAVDPRVIPLGTKLYIEAVDGSWVYGYAIAGDTGGAIKGNKVDLFYNSTSECYRFGRRPARVYVLE